jgi:hypothetical protein
MLLSLVVLIGWPLAVGYLFPPAAEEQIPISQPAQPSTASDGPARPATPPAQTSLAKQAAQAQSSQAQSSQAQGAHAP